MASLSSFITLAKALNFGPEASTTEARSVNDKSHNEAGIIPCSWNNTLSLVVIYAPAWRMRSSAQGTSSLLQLDTPSACTSYPFSSRSRVDWRTQMWDLPVMSTELRSTGREVWGCHREEGLFNGREV